MRALRTTFAPPVAALALLAAAGASCQAEPVRLYRLREAEAGSAERAAYDRLVEAVALANEFLATSSFARGFPAESARFELDHSDVLLQLGGEGTWVLHIETPGWGDPRTAFGDGYHPTANGFQAARYVGPGAALDGTEDSALLRLPAPDQAAVLLRQATLLRELRARGALDYWLNYDLLGLNPRAGWGARNPVTMRAHAVERGFREWHAQR